MRTERASYFWGAGALALAWGLAAAVLHILGAGLAAGPCLVRGHLFALGAVFALVLMGILARRRWVRALGVLAMVPLGGLTGLVGLALLLSGAFPALPVQRLPAPENRPYAAVVRESRDWIDPVWELSIDGDEPVGLSWDAGCVNGDYQHIEDLRWRSATELVVTVSSSDVAGVAVIVVDPGYGRVAGELPEVLDQC